MSPKTQKYQSLREPVSSEYERDLKPRPSGYAKVSITLIPRGGDSKTVVDIDTDLSESWELIEIRDSNNRPHKVASETELALQQEALLGITQGATAVIQEVLGDWAGPITLVIHQIVYHPVYSTIQAFKLAAEEAVKLALDKANESG
jgi:hypothetical protein